MKRNRLRKAAAILLSAMLLTGCGTELPNETAEMTTTDSVQTETTVTTETTDTQAEMQTTSSTERTSVLPESETTVTTGSQTTGAASAEKPQTQVQSQTQTEPTTSAAAPVTSSSYTAHFADGAYPELNSRISAMSLEDKIAQMLLISCHGATTPETAASGGAGGLCLYADAFEGKTKEQVVAMNAAYQDLAPIPMLISIDEEGGGVTRVSANPNLRDSKFLRPGKLYELGGWERIESDTAEKADLLLSLGVNVNLAPVCDVPQSKNDYIYWRCFSMNANETAEYVKRVVSVMSQHGIGSTLKHFPGYGGSTDTHKGMGYDSRPYEAFTQSDFLPFQSGIAAGADSVMVSHNIVACMDAENPASLSPAVHAILRDTIGYNGVIVTDDLDMNAIRDFCGTENAAVMAAKAGNDLICTPNFAGSRNAIAAAVRSGEISERQINESVLRIFIWKEKLSLLPQ